MTKIQLKNIVKEALNSLNEQAVPVPGSTFPSPNPTNARLVSWTYCDSTLLNYVAGPNHPNSGLFFADGIPGDGQLQSDNNTPPTSNGPSDQTFTQCITLGGGNIPQQGDGFKTAETGMTGPVIRDARVISVSSCTGAWGGNTIDLPYACGSSGAPDPVDPVDPIPVDPCKEFSFLEKPDQIKFCNLYLQLNFPAIMFEYKLCFHQKIQT